MFAMLLFFNILLPARLAASYGDCIQLLLLETMPVTRLKSLSTSVPLIEELGPDSNYSGQLKSSPLVRETERGFHINLEVVRDSKKIARASFSGPDLYGRCSLNTFYVAVGERGLGTGAALLAFVGKRLDKGQCLETELYARPYGWGDKPTLDELKQFYHRHANFREVGHGSDLMARKHSAFEKDADWDLVLPRAYRR